MGIQSLEGERICEPCRRPRLTVYMRQPLGKKLSTRERQVVSLILKDIPNKEIGAMLMLSEGTVKVYVSRIIQKTGSNTRVGVALWALRNGWIQESAA